MAEPVVTDIGTLITRTPGTLGGRPRIAGTRISVETIALDTQHGFTPEKIVVERPHLTLAQGHAALAYYYANQQEIDRDIAEEDRLFEEGLRRSPLPLEPES
jgi:uncharacterized protein (DUF433 family)